MNKKHTCNPVWKPFFGIDQWQCGCGRYFKRSELTKQEKAYWDSEMDKFKKALKSKLKVDTYE